MLNKPLRGCALLFAGLIASEAGAQEPEAEEPTTQTPAAPAEPAKVEEVIVTGIRGSLEQAMDIKRENMQIVDAIVAEDIGKFPDNNVVEALQRVSGVQVTGRDGGEVNTVTIRGLGDVSTTINGRQIFTASGRSIALADVPASLLAGANVYKTRSADLIEGGVAGQIDVRTHRPFDFEDSQFALAGRGIYASNTEKTDPNISALASKRWKTSVGDFGALFNASFAQTRFRDETIWNGSVDPYYISDDPALDGQRIPEFNADGSRVIHRGTALPTAPGSQLTVDGQAYEYALLRDAMGGVDTFGKRERPAANLSLQFAPNAGSTYTFESFYNGQRGDDSFSQLFAFVNGPEHYQDQQLFPGTNVVKQNYVQDPNIYSSSVARSSRTDSWLHALSGEWKLSDRFTLNSEVAYQTSSYRWFNQTQNMDSSRYRLAVDFNHDNSGTPSLVFPDNPATPGNESTLTNPDDWTLGWYYDRLSKDRGKALTWDASGEYAFDDGLFRKLKFGTRIDRRKAESNAGEQSANCPDVDSCAAYLAADSRAGMIRSNPSGFFSGEGMSFPSQWLLADYHYLLSHADETRGIYGFASGSPAFNPANYFDVEETNYAAYLQTDFKRELSLGTIDGQVGARVVKVETDIGYNELADTDTWEPAGHSKSSTDVLPSAVIRFFPRKDIIARLAYGKTIGRPSFQQLNPSMVLMPSTSTNASFGYATSGNPDLKPVEAQTLDLSLEYYFSKSSSVYTTLFMRDVDGFIIDVDRSVQISDRSPELNGNYVLTSPQNAGSGKLNGVELGFQWFPDRVPDWLRGIGVQGNYTWIDAESKDPVFDEEDSTRQIGSQKNPVVGVSDWAYSVVLAYERSGLSARLSWVDRGKFLTGYNYCCSMPAQVYSKGESSADFQLSYDATRQLTLTFDATNLTGEIYRTYYGDPQLYNQDTYRYSRTYALGFRYRF
jgi:iron complex outermembrane receptor protein